MMTISGGSTVEAPCRVLLVDDDPVSLLVLEGAIKRIPKIEIDQATNGPEAIELARRNEYATMVLDVNMPGMDGFETASCIRAEGLNENTPLIFVTAFRLSDSDRFQGYDKGAVDYLRKPVDLKIFTAKLKALADLHNEALKSRKQLDEATRRNLEMEALLQASRSVLRTADFTDSARAVFDACKSVTGARAGYVALLSPDGHENEVLFLDSGKAPCTVDPSLPMPIRGLRAEAYATGRVVFENDFMHSPWMEFMSKGHVAMRNVLFAPLNVEGQVVGIMGLANKPGNFTENDARLAGLFGDFAAMSLRNARAMDRLRDNERKMMTVRKLESVGQLAGGVAHELNTPIQYVTANIDYLDSAFKALATQCAGMEGTAEKVDAEEVQRALAEVPEALADIRVGLAKVSHIISAMKKLVPNVPGQREEIDPGTILRDLVILTESQWRGKAEVRLDIVQDLPKVFCSPGEISQAVLNILVNAIQAVEDTGRSGEIAISARPIADMVEMRISDTGPGIPEEVLSRIFDPFFTTKDVGRGTGQGLALAQMVFHTHGGEIRCESIFGRGTTFILTLPLADDELTGLS
ncbi:MAG: response regulator [Deltaproteobacteria bacterium]|nr:response regulator [Deltaproteobacteria bacterium]